MIRIPTSARPIMAALMIIGAGPFSANVLSLRATAAIAAPLFGGLGSTPDGGGTRGLFGQEIPWPLIPLHVTLLPDGRVLSYGTDTNGVQGGFYYDIWDPAKGVELDSHATLANTTATDIFCSTGSWFAPGLNNTNTGLSGKLLLLGGDITVNNVRNYSNNDIVGFDPAIPVADQKLISAGKMKFKRWYATMTTLPNGSKLLLGGQLTPGTGVDTPEIVTAGTGFRTLSEISVQDFVNTAEWWYPRATVGIDGSVYLFQNNGKILKLTTGSPATLTDTTAKTALGDYFYPAVMMPVDFSGFPRMRMMTARNAKKVQIVEVTAGLPIVTDAASLKDDRKWGSLTLLADGSILAFGGSGVYNELTDVVYRAQIFKPVQGTWTDAATAVRPRLYHSTGLLLPDGSVLTAGGGAPGPVTNRNAEIFYPPYLYNTDGTVASRPKIASAPTSLKLGETFQFTLETNITIGSVTLARAGYDTHSYDPEARLFQLEFTQDGTTVTGTLRRYPQFILPGYYMLFAFDAAGHPSIAKMVSIPQTLP